MARATAGQVKIRFEKRRDAWLRQKCEIPEVREAVAAIQREAGRRWEAGEPVESPHPVGDKPTRNPLSFGSERAVCRRNGVSVQVVEKGKDPPVVYLSRRIEAEQEELAARLHPQKLVSPAEYDLWEIRRDAPLSRILEDLEYQWRQLHEERRRRREGTLFDDTPEAGPLPRRGGSTDRTLWAVKAYRRRCQGEMWREIGQAFAKHESTVRCAAKDLSERTGLPWPPVPGTVLPAPPDVDCNSCKKRPSPSEPCAECPYPAYYEQLAARALIPPRDVN